MADDRTTELTAEEVEATMRIGELADRSSLSLRTIRHYDEVGLLRPSGRTEGGFRLYTERDFDRLLLIRRMKPLGYTLDAMTELLRVVDSLEQAETPEETAAIRARLAAFEEEASLRRAKLQDQLAMADEFLALLRAR
ncbi:MULTISPECIES: MerR family transcriptional regulator [Rathayibacter]|jgi:DNA-binding transcriptional MerR regulator|uniref:MerR family transcriptional regulator n=1 Tax=Rathayibacter TaxID=33886 RepID=UPI000F4B5367|nr:MULTISPECIES: MerR family transcriptional regulator [Rathayibacter]MCJ1698648.1 MerR family transcriptional regulator [Rathayibacter festucae]MCJ1702628.1 MerR family transcriptional regulator [Rathayibacter sp. VKM Ac-2926]ROP56695.1 DNA-binding transcriptional MerR regulator [Rathayibacter sp. PhB186]ROS55080.1 DNA-binding transcriptional MerR regulator [Rathayibacter sp. PhB185]TCL85811.1 DNA-binding transcriptional MerR regulator [Rathayibacter sp. PhB192]